MNLSRYNATQQVNGMVDLMGISSMRRGEKTTNLPRLPTLQIHIKKRHAPLFHHRPVC